ncbi:hypothetical protein MRB53_022227 [Persea americana]|uniref:Uncharacterized protein n=1 Tax=Persea americana TaxID=3435 RepID=A0ACC2L792_PERAE|nr:hypothetical protein MRB53_022227 [Persea americana]
MTLSLRLLPSRHCILSSASLPASSVIRRVRVSSSCKSTFSHQHFFKHVMSSSASSDTSSKAAAAAGGDPSPPPSNSGTGDGEENRESTDVLVQYVVLRRDLIDTWPLGSVVTQGCHASVTLEVKGESQILNLSEKLNEGGIAHKLWIEQPENIPTCLATKPYPKSAVSLFFRRLKLCK